MRTPVHRMHCRGFGRENPAPTIIPVPVFVGGGDLDAPQILRMPMIGVGTAIYEPQSPNTDKGKPCPYSVKFLIFRK